MLPGSGAATGQSENKVANGERNFKVEEDSKLGDGPQWDILKRISSKYGETIYSRQDVTRIFGVCAWLLACMNPLPPFLHCSPITICFLTGFWVTGSRERAWNLGRPKA